jgi:hypothetical protein
MELSEEKAVQLDALMQEVGARTRKELITNALTLLAWAIREKKMRRRIGSIDEQGQAREVILPILESLKVEHPPEIVHRS